MELICFFCLTLSFYIPIFFKHGDWLTQEYISNPKLNFSKLKFLYILVNPFLLGCIIGLSYYIIFVWNINLILISVLSIPILLFSFFYFFYSQKRTERVILDTYLLVKSLNKDVSENIILKECLYRRHPDLLYSNFLDDCFCVKDLIKKLIFYERSEINFSLLRILQFRNKK